MDRAKEAAAWEAASSGRDVLVVCLTMAGARAVWRGFRDAAHRKDLRFSDALMEVFFPTGGRLRLALASDSLRAARVDVLAVDGLDSVLDALDRADSVIR